MEQVTSKDGTTIAFDRIGQGAPVVLVTGGSVDRSSLAPLADLLSAQLTVLNYDRRGRGPSGDTPPYAVQREIEDIDAVRTDQEAHAVGERDPTDADRTGVAEPRGETMRGSRSGVRPGRQPALSPRGSTLHVDIERVHR